MPKVILYILFMLFVLPSTALAKVEVDISNNLEGSTNKVNVNSNTGGNNISSNQVNNETNIRINNNGEVKEYHGSGGNVEIKSDDGKSSVSVNTTGASNNSVKSSSNVNSKTNISINSNAFDASPSSTAEATVAGVAVKADMEHEEAGVWAMIKREIDRLLNLFS